MIYQTGADYLTAANKRVLLFGMNFDTKDKAQLVQVDALQRIYSDMERCGVPFTSIAFGDFNNRCVL